MSEQDTRAINSFAKSNTQADGSGSIPPSEEGFFGLVFGIAVTLGALP